MAYISREEFMAQQESKQAKRTENKVGFFKIPEGGEAVIRFAYTTPEDIAIVTFHQVAEPGKPEYQGKRYNCTRTSLNDPISNCPLCQTGLPVKQKIFLNLVEYTRDESGNIVANPKVWERSTAWYGKLMSLFEEYGDISDCIFKIKRTGSGMETRYSDPMLANPTVYNSEVYKKDFSAFEGYKIIGGLVAEKFEGQPDTAETVAPVTESAPRKVTY